MTTTLDRADERTLTDLDQVRLDHLLRRRADDPGIDLAPLEALLDIADVVPSRDVSPDIVTMYAQVTLVDAANGTRQTLTVCWPQDAEPAAGFVSVLTPVGAALLGRRVGTVARWTTPDGAAHSAEVVAVLFQPESSGDYTT